MPRKLAPSRERGRRNSRWSSSRSDPSPHAAPCYSPRLRPAQSTLSSFTAFASRAIQEEIVQQKMQLAIATDPDSYAANAALARQIASKQSGAAVNYIFSAGYGYEEPAKQYGTLPNFEVRAPWD